MWFKQKICGFALFTAIPFLSFSTFANTCTDVVAKIVAMNKARAAANGCPPTSTPHRPLTKLPEVGGPPKTVCVPNATAEAAWLSANQVAYSALITQLGACNEQACPTIPATSTHKCSAQASKLGLCVDAKDDVDGDGISDKVERLLIARFSPMLRFSLNDGVADSYTPLDPIWFIQRSELISADSNTVSVSNATLATRPDELLDTSKLGKSIDLMSGYGPTPDFTGCLNTTPEARYGLHAIVSGTLLGPGWSADIQSGHTGMYAHVSQFVPGGPGDLPALCPQVKGCQLPNGSQGTCNVIPQSVYETNSMKTRRYYKIEYYQFFGFNNDYAPFGIADHEGDLSILTLVYDVKLDKIVAVSHWAHGHEMRFDMQAAGTQCGAATDPYYGQIWKCTGVNNQYSDFEILGGGDFKTLEDIWKAQNNEVDFAPSSKGATDYNHPIVFVENGSHEFFPTRRWTVEGAPNHNGDDFSNSYVAHDIDNLGEIEHPMGAAAMIITRYSGRWGTFNVDNDNSPGPTLHKAWNWFVPRRTPIACQAAE